MSTRTYLLGLLGCVLVGALAIVATFKVFGPNEVLGGFAGLFGSALGLVLGYALGFRLERRGDLT